MGHTKTERVSMDFGMTIYLVMMAEVSLAMFFHMAKCHIGVLK